MLSPRGQCRARAGAARRAISCFAWRRPEGIGRHYRGLFRDPPPVPTTPAPGFFISCNFAAARAELESGVGRKEIRSPAQHSARAQRRHARGHRRAAVVDLLLLSDPLLPFRNLPRPDIARIDDTTAQPHPIRCSTGICCSRGGGPVAGNLKPLCRSQQADLVTGHSYLRIFGRTATPPVCELRAAQYLPKWARHLTHRQLD